MKPRILKSVALIAPVVALMAGCKVDKGQDFIDDGDQPIVFSEDALNIVVDEDQGLINIDLLQGGTVGGDPLSSLNGVGVSQVSFSQETITWDPNAENNDQPMYGLPVPTVVENGKQITPFTLDGTNLAVDLAGFDDRLSSCSEFTAGESVNPWPRPNHTYTITYNVINGGDPVTRTLNLTINGIFSTIEVIDVQNLSIRLGESASASASFTPENACDQELVYAIADESVATVDDAGNVTGVSVGETELTVSNPESNVSSTVKVTIDSNFRIGVSNAEGPRDALVKEIAACTYGGLHVEPEPTLGEVLSGVYTYSWSTSEESLLTLLDLVQDAETENGEWAILQIGDGDKSPASNVAQDAEAVSVAYVSGETTAAKEDIDSLSVAVNVVPNKACLKANNAGNASNWDHTFEHSFPGNGYNKYISGAFDQAVGDPIFGSSLRVTAEEDNTIAGVVKTNWTNGNAAFDMWGSYYGVGTRGHGVEFGVSMWVKLEQPREGVKVHFNLAPWHDSRNSLDNKAAGSFPNAAKTGSDFAVELAPTTAWQLVNLVNRNHTEDEADDSATYTIPTTWAIDGTANTTVMPFVYATGLTAGDQILFDDIAVIEK
ncbi:Ig-like domain-containing protein [Microbulbifer agarilyticus]|uniref:Ig-like domain-containing protein n=1 Tax=Microbulbifer agarilyticus TaxID=260552 RepID=UPI001C98A0C6|nr:Ig-like domain-containing protein [Microbulbifer agarilyticus]MBY6211997.1 Ig-like domain-containing protein [Microbulbifer agarilyticus]